MIKMLTANQALEITNASDEVRMQRVRDVEKAIREAASKGKRIVVLNKEFPNKREFEVELASYSPHPVITDDLEHLRITLEQHGFIFRIKREDVKVYNPYHQPGDDEQFVTEWNIEVSW